MEVVLDALGGVRRFDMDAKPWSVASEAGPLSAAAVSRPDRVHSGWHHTADLARGSRLFVAAFLFTRLRIEVKFRLHLSLGWTRYQIREAVFCVRLALGWIRRLIRDPAVLALQLVRGAAYFCLADLAHRSPWFARAALRRMYGRKSLSVDVPCGTGQEVACFEYTNSHADGNELERLAKTSSARWILIRQAGYSSPKPPLFRAPVRQLQPGEACRVLAPVSETNRSQHTKKKARGLLTGGNQAKRINES